MRRLVAILLIFGGLMLHRAQAQSQSESFTLEVGTTPVRGVVTVCPGKPWSDSGVVFVSVHDDENESALAARRIVEEFGGRLVELQHTGERNITFALSDARRYSFDPNRIYTEVGRPYGFVTDDDGPVDDVEALQAVEAFSRRLLEDYILQGSRLVVAVHNNGSPEYDPPGLTLHDEIIGPETCLRLEPHGDRGRQDDPRFSDFLLVNLPALYDVLGTSGLNVGLVDSERLRRHPGDPRINDGSLSVLFTLERPLPYINVEALRDRAKPPSDPRPAAAERQEAMLRVLLTILEQNRALWNPSI